MREKKISSLALSLRKLLIDSKNMTSLVTLMGIRRDLWFSPICTFSASDYAGNLVPVYPLITTHYDGTNFYCKSINHWTNTNLRFQLDSWLNEIVIDPKCGCIYKPTRLDVIRIISDKEGGAHYEKEHDKSYFEIIHNFAFEIKNEDGSITELCNNLYFETLLSIAFEFLEAIKEYIHMRPFINRAVSPCSLYIVETSYRINGNKGLYNKYVHSQNVSFNKCFQNAFDTNGKACYRLIKTNNIFFYSIMENKNYNYVLLDFDNTYELVFLADMKKPRPKSYALIKNKKGYSIVAKKEELATLDRLRTYTFNQAINILSSGNPQLFDFSLSKQYVLDDKR